MIGAPGRREEETESLAAPTREWTAAEERGVDRDGLRPHPASARRLPSWTARAAAALAMAAVLVVVGVAVLGGSDDGNGDGGSGTAAAKRYRTADRAGPGEGSGSSRVPEPSGNDAATGAELNEQGYALIQEGRADEAVPVLEEAVSSFPPGTEDLDYAYALFNLGSALRLSGRPEQAIPVLERRLAIPNQTEVVERELEAARADASS